MSKGLNQTSGACGTQTRSSSGMAGMAISALMPGCCVMGVIVQVFLI